MENIATNNPLLKISSLLCVLLVTLVSCGGYIGQYSEDDGAYYDPESDILPRDIDLYSNNRIGNVYQYGSYGENISDLTTSEENTDSIVQKSKQNEKKQQSKYQNWGKKDSSDWGKYVGTKVYVSNYYIDPWRNPYYGWYHPYGMSFGWRHYYDSWGRYYDPFWGWSYYPYHTPYRHRTVYYRSVPKYKERRADSIDRSRYNYGNDNKYRNSNKNSYKAGTTYKSGSNEDESGSRSSGRAVGTSGGGFRR